MSFENNCGSQSAEDIDDNGAASISSEDEVKCYKLQLPEHIVAYMEKRELSRDIEPLTCENSLLEKVTANYVIAKEILSNLSWQDKVLCKTVCSMWHSVVHALRREQLWPVDLAISLRIGNIKNGIKLLKSSKLYTEPLAVFVFTNRAAFITSSRCESLVPSPCEPACDREHYLIDLARQDVAAPKNCMVTVKVNMMSYLPLPRSITYDYSIRHKMYKDQNPFLGAIYIPAIPNVEFTLINISSISFLKEDFYDVLDKIPHTYYIKGVLVFANENYILGNVEDIIFINYFKTVQPNYPFALGGCIVDDTITNPNDINQIIDGLNEGKDFNSENLITIGVFLVPRHVEQEQACNFEMYSIVLESSDWEKAKIQQLIINFSKRVPHFEYSVAIKLSCVGRDMKHELENQYFRNVFPTTRIIGCYGNGELGINHPARPEPEPTAKSSKRSRGSGPQFGLMYSYSTVFVYCGWGKIIRQPLST